jgi:hypothetical protein
MSQTGVGEVVVASRMGSFPAMDSVLMDGVVKIWRERGHLRVHFHLDLTLGLLSFLATTV